MAIDGDEGFAGVAVAVILLEAADDLHDADGGGRITAEALAVGAVALAATVRLMPLLTSDKVSVSSRALFNGEFPPGILSAACGKRRQRSDLARRRNPAEPEE